MERYGGPVRVACATTKHGEEEPCCFRYGRGERWVEAVLDRWLDPGHRYFKVKTTDGDVVMLRHDVASRRWELYLFAPP